MSKPIKRKKCRTCGRLMKTEEQLELDRVRQMRFYYKNKAEALPRLEAAWPQALKRLVAGKKISVKYLSVIADTRLHEAEWYLISKGCVLTGKKWELPIDPNA